MATVQKRVEGAVTIFEVAGTLTIDHGPIGLYRALAAALGAGARALVVNVRGVSTIDSFGVSELASCHTAAVKRGARVIFCELSPKIRDILTITRLKTVFETAETEGIAVGLLQS
jgi:anti-sigma B factor antagonist